MSGIFTGLLSGIFWSFDSIAISYMSISALLVAGLHDGLSSLILIIGAFVKKNVNVNFKSKSTKIIVFASFMGSVVGMSSYVACIAYSGAGVAAVVSCFYPIFTVILSKFILRQNLSNLGKIGLVLAILGMLIVSLSGSKFENFNTIGLLFGLLCAVGWGSECVIINLALKEDVNPYSALLIRQCSSFLIYLFVICLFFSLGEISNKISEVGKFLIPASVFGTLSYLLYYFAIQKLGALKAMGLNISYCAWTILIGYMLGGGFSYMLFISAVMIIAGCILTNL